MIKDHVPEWAKKAVGYQCFVDSFAIGDIYIENKNNLYDSNVYSEKAFTLNWNEKDENYHYGHGFYGGDLKGVAYALDHYLKDLDINLLYLTPIFKAATNHKYDIIDYEQIDPQFGKIEDFRELMRICKKNNVHLIMDGVFNHTSSEHKWYKKAVKGDERYRDFYKRNEEEYILLWEGVETLPELNHENEEVQNYFYKGNDSIVKKWLREGADGWRLDVAERLGKKPINAIRRNIKEYNPEALLIGEVVESYGKEWLADGLLDGVMNYVFRGITTNFLTGSINAKTYIEELNKMYSEYPTEKLYASWNIISTHDTNRMLYDVHGNESTFKMAVILQFTYPGIPIIYYGDELGMSYGKKEISNRTGMDWDVAHYYRKNSENENYNSNAMEWNRLNRYNSYHQFYKHMIWLRKNIEVFSTGCFIPLYADDTVLSFARVIENETALIIANNGPDKEISITIPEIVTTGKMQLKCLYGADNPLTIYPGTIEIYVGGANSYIYAHY